MAWESLYVDAAGNDANPGTSASPKLTVAGAITDASSGDTIYVGAGTFTGAIDFNGKALNLIGVAPTLTVLALGSSFVPVIIAASGSTLRNFYANHTHVSDGAGIYVDTLRDLLID